jgi:fermentation-respiration switch protein FrsA (DUF1100 family)
VTWSAAALMSVRAVLIAGGIVVAAVLALKIGALFLEPRLLFHPVRQYAATPSALGLPFEDVSLEAGDGVRLHGWLIPGEGKVLLTLLFFHGNAENIGGCLDLAMLTRPAGYDLLLVDYRGYGESTGSPSEKGLYLDGRAAMAYLRSRRPDEARRIVVWGRSIGAAVAVDLAAADPSGPDGVILETPFTSVPALLHRGGHRILYGLSRFGTYRLDSASRIARVRAPLLVIHGTADEIAPFSLGRELFDLAPGRKEFVTIEGGGHNDLWAHHEDAMWSAVLRFLSTLD